MLAKLLLLAGVLQPLAAAESLYTKKSPVLQVDANSYDSLIEKSNYASIVEFYAPWCGHCQKLKPAFEKTAERLNGLAKVAAVNCDDDMNKQLCSQLGVQGFPSLKIITPSEKPGGKPGVLTYNGKRTTKAMVDEVIRKIPNHVTRVTDKDLTDWLATDNSTAKAILFSDKGAVKSLPRSLAIDFLGKINFGQIRNKESSAVEMFGIEEYPTLVLLPGGEQDPLVYDGEMKKKDMLAFLSQAAEPNPDPVPAQKKNKDSKSSKTSTTSTSTPTADDAAENTDAPEDITWTTFAPPSATPSPETPPLRILTTSTDIRTSCLSRKTSTCVLAMIPLPEDPEIGPPITVGEGTNHLAEIAHKHALRQGNLFPFYMVPDVVEEVALLQDKLDLKFEHGIEIIAVNGRRGWWRRYEPGEDVDYGLNALEAWIDGIRLGEGEKHKFPEGILRDVDQEEDAKAPEPEEPKHEEL